MPTLYHASPQTDLTEIAPQPTLSRDVYIGDFVFATADKKLAIMYLAPKGFPVLLNSQAKVPRIIACTDPSHYKSKDKGGAIYELPDNSFQPSPQAGLEDYEFVSSVGVVPQAKSVYRTSLSAMKDAGIAVYFVDRKVFDSMLHEKNEAAVVAQLSPYNE